MASSSTGPLTHYNELVLNGRAPELDAYCAQHPDCPDLRQRILEVRELRQELLDLRGSRLSARQPPRTIAGVRLLAPLGRGGMGEVYLGEQQTPERLVAVKLMRPNRASLPRFKREAELATTLDHPAIARVLDFGSEDGVAYLVTEFVHGFTLQELALTVSDATAAASAQWLLQALTRMAPGSRIEKLARQEGAVKAAVGLISQVADALAHAHGRGVVHRDVKPSNIMVTFDGTTKLIDFGLAVAPQRADTRITLNGMFIGTTAYAAPEQLRGEQDAVGPWTDTYALGVTLFELLTRQLPFSNTDTTRGTFIGPRELLSDVPAHLDAIVRRALAPDRESRFADGGAFLRALRRRATLGMGPAPRLFEKPAPMNRETSLWDSVRLAGRSSEDVFRGNYRTLRALFEAAPAPGLLLCAANDPARLEAHTFVPLSDAESAVIVGRHSRAGLQLAGDPGVSLRHLLVRPTLQGERVRVRILDLRTETGFEVGGVGRCRSLVHVGPLCARLGSYSLMLLPTGGAPWPDDPSLIWERLTRLDVRDVDAENVTLMEAPGGEVWSGSTRAVVLPPVDDTVLATLPQDVAGTLRLVGTPMDLVVGRSQLRCGVLLGRYTRCDAVSEEVWDSERVSRVHLLLLEERRGIVAVDTASQNGTLLNGRKLSAALLRQGDVLQLGDVVVQWKAAARA